MHKHFRSDHNPRALLHKKSWAVIDRPYNLGFATVGALYERPQLFCCAKPHKERFMRMRADLRSAAAAAILLAVGTAWSPEFGAAQQAAATGGTARRTARIATAARLASAGLLTAAALLGATARFAAALLAVFARPLFDGRALPWT